MVKKAQPKRAWTPEHVGTLKTSHHLPPQFEKIAQRNDLFHYGKSRSS